ncbi:MAG: hypothetical protein ABJA98_01570 [Acidobacteriota bacterium]
MKTRNPRTPAEWQAAVNAAEALLLLQSARLYGLLLACGPKVHVARCEQILAQGRARQVVPIRDGVDAYINELVSAGPDGARGPSPTAVGSGGES